MDFDWKYYLLITIVLILFIAFIALFNLAGKFVLKFILNQIEDKIEYFYKVQLLSYTIKGGNIGGALGPLIFSIGISIDLANHFYSSSNNILRDRDIKNLIEMKNILIDFYYGHNIFLIIILGFILLLVILSLLIFYFYLFFTICTFLGAILGAIINIFVGLTISILSQIKDFKFELYKFKFDIPTFITTGILGFLGGIIFLKDDFISSGILGILSAIISKYLAKIKTQIIFYYFQKASIFILNNKKMVFITIAISYYLIKQLLKNVPFSLKNFIDFILLNITILLFLLFWSKISKNKYFLRYYIFFKKTLLNIDYIKNFKIKKLPKNLLLHFFSILLILFLTFIISIGTGNFSKYWIFSIILSIIFIEKVPFSWIVILYGFVIESKQNGNLYSQDFSYYTHILLWAIYGNLILYLLKKGNNNITLRKAVEIKKWIT